MAAALLPLNLSCLGHGLPQVNFGAFLHGFVMTLCQIVAVTKGRNKICNGSRCDRKGILPLLYCPLVYLDQFKCIFTTFVTCTTVHYKFSEQ